MRVHPALALAVLSLVGLGGCDKKHKAAPTPVAVGAPFPGSYALTCKAMTDMGHGMLSAECADAQGQMHGNTIQASACKGDIANMNGVLTCNGAVATSTPIGTPAASDAPAASNAASDTIALRP